MATAADWFPRLPPELSPRIHDGAVPWIFAYGTLMGDNALRYYETTGTPTLLRGFHRAFNHASTHRWGTPERPCPVLGLSPGGECWGVAYDVPGSDRRSVLRGINAREGRDEYRAKRVLVALRGNGDAKATAWVTKPRVLAAARWPTDPSVLERAFREAHGVVGSGVEYVRTVVHAMDRWHVGDPLIEALWERLEPYSNPRG